MVVYQYGQRNKTDFLFSQSLVKLNLVCLSTQLCVVEKEFPQGRNLCVCFWANSIIFCVIIAVWEFRCLTNRSYKASSWIYMVRISKHVM